MVDINVVNGLKAPIDVVGVSGSAVVSVLADVKSCHHAGLERSYKGRSDINDVGDWHNDCDHCDFGEQVQWPSIQDFLTVVVKLVTISAEFG